MSESTNEPVILTGNQLIALIKPVILEHTKHEDYTNQILEMVDTGTRMRLSYDNLSPAGMLAYSAIRLLDPVDPLVVEVITGILMDRLRNMEPPADLPLREAWLRTRDELLASFHEAKAMGAMADIEVHSITPDDLAVDWAALSTEIQEGEANG